VIVLDEAETDLDALIEEMQAEVQKHQTRFSDSKDK
jgi:hypothetical protein